VWNSFSFFMYFFIYPGACSASISWMQIEVNSLLN
jgi:hypothetical protein